MGKRKIYLKKVERIFGDPVQDCDRCYYHGNPIDCPECFDGEHNYYFKPIKIEEVE
jgi:hypothetical protein